jgi:surface antigen
MGRNFLRGSNERTHGFHAGTRSAWRVHFVRDMRKALFLFLCLGCSSTENLGTSSERVDMICSEPASATIDGIPAYDYCGNFDVWSNNGVDTKSASGGAGWIRTETNYGYQCTELALRYLHFEHGITTVWKGISYADEMCATHPAGVSVVGTPAHGDLMVFAAGSCGADSVAGHVAVVDTVNASTIDVVQQNPAGKVTWNTACASCFLRADPPPPDAGVDAAVDASPDASVVQDASAGEDATPVAEAGADSGVAPPPTSNGCSITTARASSYGWLGLALACVVIGRRRRCRCQSSSRCCHCKNHR